MYINEYNELYKLMKMNNDIDKEKDILYDISKDLCEVYLCDTILYCDMRYNIIIDTRNMFSEIPYIRFYDNIIPSKASYCARISLLKPEYILCGDTKIPNKPLLQKHKNILINILNTSISNMIECDNWESFKFRYSENLKWFDRNELAEYILNLPKPDYTDLSTR